MIAKPIKAIDALQDAQKIAFAPFVFQTTVALRNLGVFSYIFENRDTAKTDLSQISDALSISTYGLGVLLEIAESADLVACDEKNVTNLLKQAIF